MNTAPSLRTKKARKKRIVIVGLLKGQKNIVQFAVEGTADIRFVRKEASRERFGEADEIVLMRFNGHSVQDRAVKTVGRNRVTFHSGGLKKLIERLKTM